MPLLSTPQEKVATLKKVVWGLMYKTQEVECKERRLFALVAVSVFFLSYVRLSFMSFSNFSFVSYPAGNSWECQAQYIAQIVDRRWVSTWM